MITSGAYGSTVRAAWAMPAASPAATAVASRPSLRAWAASASALAAVRVTMVTRRVPSPMRNASRCARAWTPAPISSRSPAGSGASSRAASSETAAVRCAVTVGPSSSRRRTPVAASITTTSPWMAGSPRVALCGCTVIILVMAISVLDAGISSRLPGPGTGITSRAGAWARPARASRSTCAMASARAAYGRRAAVAVASRVCSMAAPSGRKDCAAYAGATGMARRGGARRVSRPAVISSWAAA